MSIINEYQEKQRALRQLREELQQMEEKKELQQELAFKEAVEELLEKFGKTETELMALFGKEEKATEGSGKGRRKRTPTVYRQPDGTEIVVRGGRQKDYQEWIQKYGKEKVQSWKVVS